VTLVPKARRKACAALLAGFLLSPAACKNRPSGSQEPRPASSRPAAPAFTLKDLEGHSVSLSQFKGKAVFLDFWATWCGPCQMSMPEVEKMERDYAGKGLQVLGMNVDEDPSVVGPFVRQMGSRHPVLLVGSSGVDGQYQVSGIPAFFLIDKAGRVADMWVGFDPSYSDQWRRDIDRLLAQ
jgi:thiol-disulfide isomerase/thioredoxin